MSDLISRQAAIDALRTCYDTETITMDNGDEYINYDDAVGEIEQLPPAQPEIIRCKDCKYWKQQTNYQGIPLSFGFCENDNMWRSLCGETCEISHIETDDNHYCGYAERRTNE